MWKKALLVTLLVIAVAYGGLWVYALNTNPVYAEGRTEVEQVSEVIYKFRIEGHSMEPTIRPGQYTSENRSLQPKAGDVIGFTCLNRCQHPDGSAKTVDVVKRLIEIRADGAWWVLGDNRDHSWDSSEYGWILPSERSHVGVVVEILN